MSNPEQLLAALAERERLLRQERTSAAHARTLLKAIDALNTCEVPEQGIAQVLEISSNAVGGDLAVMLSRGEDDTISTRLKADSGFGFPRWSVAPEILARKRRVTDVAETLLSSGLPAEARAFRSLILVPVTVVDEVPMAIMVLSKSFAKFSRFDHELLQRVATLLERAIERLRLAHRNAVLAQIVDSDARAPLTSYFAQSSSFEVLGRAYAHVVDWQRNIVDITNKLLNARSEVIDTEIHSALARTGQLARSDRTYVFRLRAPDRLDNTHEWVADSIAPMMEELQDLPDTLLDDWREDFEVGRSVDIPDVNALPDESAVREILQMQGIRSLLAVPMLLDGHLTGFVGYDAVRTQRRFLPIEIELLHSVANAIGVVLDRFRAESEAFDANLRLELERDRYRATLAAIPDLVLELSAEGRFIGYSAGARVAPAYPLDGVIDRVPEEVLPEHLARLAREIMLVVDRDGYAGGYRYAMTIDRKDRWFEVSAAAKRAEEGGGGYVFLVHDITESHQQQVQIRRLGRIAELTSNLVIITDPEGRIDWVNPAFEARSGWKLDEVRGRKPGDFLQSPKTDRATLDRISDAIRHVRPVQAQLLNCNRAGQHYWIAMDIQPLIDDAGRLDGFVSVQTDITELKKVHQRALRVRALAMETASDGIAISNSDGHYFFMNNAHRKMFGVDPHEDVSNLSWQAFVPPAERDRFISEEWPKLEATGSWRGELSGLHRNGRLIQQEITLSRTDDGGLLCLARDVSEQRALENDRAQLRENLQLAQRRETIAQIASGVAHDLNNLVAVVAGTVSLLEIQSAGKVEIGVGLTRITRAMDAARDLVAGLGRSTRTTAPRTQFDLRQILAEAVDLLGSKRRKLHSIQVELSEDAQQVWANHTELLQVILNLALNACEAASDGSSHVALVVGTRNAAALQRKPDVGEFDPNGAYSVFQVSDTGTGLDPTVRDTLFETYVTTKGSAGTGMGLAIVAGILRDNASALWFDSVADKGVTVTVAWPQTGAPPQPATNKILPVACATSLAGHRILVIDDVVDVADVLSEMLETDGATSIAVSDPEEALALLSDNPGLWSAVVTDLDMPTINGVEIAKTAARLEPPIPCVLITALPERVPNDRDLFHSVLSKPIKAQSLIRDVRDAVSSGVWKLARTSEFRE